MPQNKNLVAIRQALIKRRDALLGTLRSEMRTLLAKNGPDVGDQMDSAVDAEFVEVSSQLAECESRELENIQLALQRLRQGKYGQCEECDGKIPILRLRALPYATRCVACQQQEDRRGGAAAAATTARAMRPLLDDDDVGVEEKTPLRSVQ